MFSPGEVLYDHHPLGFETSADAEQSNSTQFKSALGAGEAEAVLDRLQRNGGALASCECGSRNWLPPDGIYQLVAVASRRSNSIQRLPSKSVVPLTCAACGFTKFYDPVVVASMAESTGRW